MLRFHSVLSDSPLLAACRRQSPAAAFRMWHKSPRAQMKSPRNACRLQGPAGLCRCRTPVNEYVSVGVSHMEGRCPISSDIRGKLHQDLVSRSAGAPSSSAWICKHQLSSLAHSGISRSVTCKCKRSNMIDITC